MIRPVSVATPGLQLRLERMLFNATWFMFCRWTPRPMHAWRALVLRTFGARIGAGAHVYPDCRIWLPRHLDMAAGACLGPGVECYCVAPVRLGRDAIVSQDAYLCTASHDFRSSGFDLIAAPIEVGEEAWIAARVVVLPGVHIGRRAVLAAASVLSRDAEAGTVYAGNPALAVSRR